MDSRAAPRPLEVERNLFAWSPSLLFPTLSFLILLSPGCLYEKFDCGRQDAYRACGAVLLQPPGMPPPSCEFLNLCANEANLSPGQRERLSAMLAESNCPRP